MTPYEIGQQLAIKTAGLLSQAPRAAEVAGLGMLSVPVIDKMRSRRWMESRSHENAMNGLELAGLATLAAPSAAKLIRMRLR